MNSLILRGYGRFDRVITRGYGVGWLGRMRGEIIALLSRIHRGLDLSSKLNRGC